MCEGGLRRHVKANDKRSTNYFTGTALKTLNDHCEEEPDAGGRIPSSPQTDALPELPPRTAGVRGKAAYLDI